MQQQSLQPNLKTFTLALRSCAKGALWEEAMVFLKDAQGQDPPVDVTAYAASVDACTAGTVTDALRQVPELLAELSMSCLKSKAEKYQVMEGA
eukprot:symbB.v1.2.009587.t1/scaffold608.1/size181862/4